MLNTQEHHMDKDSNQCLEYFKQEYAKVKTNEEKYAKITEILSIQMHKYYEESLESVENHILKIIKGWQTEANPFFVQNFFNKIVKINRKRLSTQLQSQINEITSIIGEDDQVNLSEITNGIDFNDLLENLNVKLDEMNEFYRETIEYLRKKFSDIIDERFGHQQEVEFRETDFQSDTESMAKTKSDFKRKLKKKDTKHYSDSELDKMLVDLSLFTLDMTNDDDTQSQQHSSITNDTSLATFLEDSNQQKTSPLVKVARPKVSLGMKVFALRDKEIYLWDVATLIKTVERDGSMSYFVRFTKSNAHMPDNDFDEEGLFDDEREIIELSSQFIAHVDKFDDLPIKARVVALYKNENNKKKLNYSSGIIAELPKDKNRKRYLIFFDDGYAQYARASEVHLIFDQSWPKQKLHPDHIRFLDQYFSRLPERTMVKLEKSHVLMICYANNWHRCRVVDVDGSLVKVFFDSTHHFEWIYRGSYRLLPFYEQNQKNGEQVASTSRHDELPYLSANASTSYPLVRKQIARKTTVSSVGPRSSVSSNGSITLHQQQQQMRTIPQGTHRMVDLQELARNEIIHFTPHPCTPSCVSQWNKLLLTINKKIENLLLIPALLGWQRHVRIQSKESYTKIKRDVHYMAPCGRTLRSISEVDTYLLRTNCNLTIDMFTFDPQLRVDREFIPNGALISADLSEGKEDMVITCVNCIDASEKPVAIQYSKNRVPLEGVPLSIDENLLDGCDCTDGCRDKLKCSCWRKTYEATTFIDCHHINTDVGYKYRRLNEVVNTGIFECNPKCKCDYRCNNRVVQNGISARLQLFKTANKGWGLRALDDIAKGSFVCIYTGHLMTEEQSDLRGQELGDEYFAELDFIECVRRVKQASTRGDESTDSDEYHARQKMHLSLSQTSQSRQIDYICLSDDDDDDNDDVNSQTTQSIESSSSLTHTVHNYSSHTIQVNNTQVFRTMSKRKDKQVERDNVQMGILASNRFFTNKNNRFYYKNYLLGNNEVYIMDAKICGNIGRYFNHSCSPNIFVQNVFVDTYDLRFPWIAFFASQFIRAGTELCWDYNYTIDSVKGRKLFCHCGSAACRGRLL